MTIALAGRKGPGSRPGPVLARASSLLALAGLGFGVVACRGQSAPEEWLLTLEPLRALGQGTAPGALTFYQPTALGFDARDRVYVLDSGNDRVQVFDPDGDLVDTIGGPGQGPGALNRPESMAVLENGALVVADTGNRRLQRYAADGRELGAVDLEFVPLDVVATDRAIYVLRLPSPSQMFGPEQDPLVVVFDPEGNRIGHAMEPQSHEVGILFFLLNTGRLAAAPDNGFAVAQTHVRARVRVFDASADATTTFGTLYKAQSWAPLGRLPAQVSEESVDQIAKTATDLAWDQGRRLFWVLSGAVDRRNDGSWVRGTELYRYTPDGTYRGSVMLPIEATAVAVAPNGAVWLIDREGVVHGYRLRDPDLLSTPVEPSGDR